MFGLLNVDKPAGATSRDVVNRIQRLVRPVKVGHAGTLDPLATGVLVVCLGRATRLVQYVQQLPKFYTAEFLLGRRSDTDDVDGDVVPLDEPPVPTMKQIEAAMPSFVGEISQRPPAYSAIKVQGQRAYRRARRGERVELSARPVRIFELSVQSYEYPSLVMQIKCGSGTYIRALGRDLAGQLRTAAVMSKLQRTAIGDFCVANSIQLDQLDQHSLSAAQLPAKAAVAAMAQIQLNQEEPVRVAKGQALQRPQHGFSTEVAALDTCGELIAILRPHGPDLLSPVKSFVS